MNEHDALGNEWRENEVLGHCRSAASFASSIWIGMCLDLGLWLEAGD
jgi:hypothetical protein